jgi:hypothetical protein
MLSLIEGFCHGIGQSAAKTVERRPPAAKDVDFFLALLYRQGCSIGLTHYFTGGPNRSTRSSLRI